MSFKAVRIFVFTAMDLEADLIVHHAKGGKLAWNNSGFGANDPGRNRDRSEIKETHFDARHPIDTDFTVDDLSFGKGTSAAEALEKLRELVPYNLRFEREGNDPHSELSAAKLGGALKPKTTREALKAIIGALPKGWTATVLPGYIILYRERATYPSAQYQIKSA